MARKQPLMISCCATWTHALSSTDAGILFWQKENIWASDPPAPRLRSKLLAGGGYEHVRSTCLFSSRCILHRIWIPSHSSKSMMARVVFSCLKTSWFKTILESMLGISKRDLKALSRCASLSHHQGGDSPREVMCTYHNFHACSPWPSLSTCI